MCLIVINLCAWCHYPGAGKLSSAGHTAGPGQGWPGPGSPGWWALTAGPAGVPFLEGGLELAVAANLPCTWGLL